MSDPKPPVRMGEVTRIIDEPMTSYEKQRLHDVQQLLLLRQKKLRAIKDAFSKLIGGAIKENEARLLGDGGTTQAIKRGTYPAKVDCLVMVDEETYEVFVVRADDGREVPYSRRKLTEAQIKKHKASRAQLGMLGEGSWTPIKLPELDNDADRTCDDIDVSELEVAAGAEIIDLAAVRAMIENDLVNDDESDDEEEEERPRKRKSKDSAESGDGSTKKKKGAKTKPELHVITEPGADAERGPYAGATPSVGETIPPSVRVVYVLYVDGSLETVDMEEASHFLRKCAMMHGDSNDVHADTCDGGVIEMGDLPSTSHKFVIRRVPDTNLAGVNALMCKDGEVLIGYVAQEDPLEITTVTTPPVDASASNTNVTTTPRIKIDIPDELRLELRETMMKVIRVNGGSINTSELLEKFALEAQFKVADVPAMIADNLVAICDELCAEGALSRRVADDENVGYSSATLH